MNTDNLSPYFEEMRNSGFIFSGNDASLVIEKAQPANIVISRSKALIMVTVFLVAMLILIYVKESKNPEPALSKFSGKTEKINTSIQNVKETFSHNQKNKRNQSTPGTGNKIAGKDSAQSIKNEDITKYYHPQSKTYFTIYPSPLFINSGSINFRVPDISNWDVSLSSQSCSSVEDKKNSNGQTFGTERLDSIKLIVCTDEEYAKLGIHRTKTGIFIQCGDHYIVCYNRYGLYSAKDFTGNLTAPIPILVTDDYGIRVRSYFIDDPTSMMKKFRESKKSNGGSAEFTHFSTQVLMSTLNTLIPVLVVNKQDTSHGIYSSNIIVWYDPGSFMFKGLVPEELKKKLLYNLPIHSSAINQLNAQNDSALNTIVHQKEKTSVKLWSVLKLWSDFQVYPNPVCIEFNLSFNLNDNKNLKINLFDISGRMVKTLQPESLFPKGKTDFKFNISGLKTGMYILAVESSTGEIWTQRLIKQ